MPSASQTSPPEIRHTRLATMSEMLPQNHGAAPQSRPMFTLHYEIHFIIYDNNFFDDLL